MKKLLLALLLLSLALTSFAAEETAPSPSGEGQAVESVDKGIHPALVFVMLEGAIAFNAGLAVASPEGMGVFMMATAPLTPAFGTGNSSTATMITAGACYFGIGLYNATVPKREDLSNAEIFRNNVIGWHLLAAATALSDYLFPKNDGAQGLSVIALPAPGGAIALLSYNF
jgi:hypothetical protein